MKSKSFLFILLTFLFISFCNKKTYFTPKKHLIQPILPVERKYWPKNNWQTNIINNNTKIKNLEKVAFPHYNSSVKKEEQVATNALLIIQNGEIIYEKYANGFYQNSSHILWSISKSITSALYGIAVLQKYIKAIDYPIAKYYKPYSYKKRNSITFQNFLNMDTGIIWREEYEDKPFFSHAVAMLYTFGRNETGKFFSRLNVQNKPGEYHKYSTGNSVFLMFLLQEILKEKYHNFAWEELYNPIGMSHVVMETDSKAKTFYGGSYIYASARDLAKFAFLYLNDGIWNNQRILPKNWVDFSRTPCKKCKFEYNKEEPNVVYGAHWWLNVPFFNQKPLPDAPKDTFFADGHWGQYIFIIPSLDFILVRLGNDRGELINKNLLVKYGILLSKSN